MDYSTAFGNVAEKRTVCLSGRTADRMADDSNRSPGARGFRRHAEWAPHEATWLTWPHCQVTWPGVVLAEVVEPAYVAMIDALRGGETVNVCVLSDDHAAYVADRLRQSGIASGEGTPVRLRVVPTTASPGWTP